MTFLKFVIHAEEAETMQESQVTVSSYTPCCRLPYAAFENTEKGFAWKPVSKTVALMKSRGPYSF